MEKTLEFLEKNVQWFALGLGAIVLLWAAWAYVATPPASVMIPGKGVAFPGDVALITKQGPVEKLRVAINSKTDPEFATNDIVKPWMDQMSAPKVPPLPPQWADSETSAESPIPTTNEINPGNIHVAALPVLPKAQPLPPMAGLSVVQLADANANQNNAPPPGHAQSKDLVWVTQPAKIPADALSKAFAAPLKGQSIDPNLYNTTVLQIVLQRQQATGVDGNGQPTFPSDDTGVEEVPPLTIYKAQLQPIPPETADAGLKYEYNGWAQKHDDLIARPTFYKVSAGTAWTAPQAVVQPAAKGPVAAAAPKGKEEAAKPGQIDPLALQSDIVIWAHDETVQPGQTYRYRIIYKMKSPVFGSRNIADAKLVDQFALVSPPSDWGQPVVVPENTKFWITSLSPDKALVDVFQWTSGNWKASKQALAAGDQIPGTGMTLVDVRGMDAREKDKYALFTDNSGDMIQRYLSTDRTNADHQNMLNQANPGAGANDVKEPAPPATPPTARRGPSPNGQPVPGGPR